MGTIFSKLKERIRSVLERLSARPHIGGLCVTDSSLFYYSGGNGAPRTFSLRIPPGVLADGKIADRGQFSELITQFREMVDAGNRTRALSVVVTLPAAVVYTQSFNVPNVGAARLSESAELNLRVISPLPHESAYMSWQVIRETPEQFELLGAFAERQHVDAFKECIEAAHFHPIAVEFPGLALVRLVACIRRSSDDPLLIFHLSSDGLSLIITRNGLLCFDYFRSWQSVQGKGREISRTMFDEVVAQEVQKVANFSLSRFQAVPQEAIIIAPGFEIDLQQFIKDRFGFQTTTLDLSTWGVDQSWAVALGASFRGEGDRSTDTAVSLSPVGSAELFYQEQLLSFIGFWRIVVAAVLGIFLVLFAGGAYLLEAQSQTLGQQLSIFSGKEQGAKLRELTQQAERFNALVSTITKLRGAGQQQSVFMVRIRSLATRYRITVSSFNSVTGFANPVELLGFAESFDELTRFRQALQSEPDFGNVLLPVSRVSTREDGTVAFSMSFIFDPEKTPTSTTSTR